MQGSFGRCHAEIFVFLIFFLWSQVLVAQDEAPLPPVTTSYAIIEVTIIPSPGVRIDKGIVVIKNGLIHSVGKDVPVPPDALIIKGDSLFVYAGFIDGLSYSGVSKPRDEKNEKPKDPGNPPPDRVGITPYIDVRDFLMTNDHMMKYLRCAGITTAHVMPYGVFLPGKGAIILMDGNSVGEMVLQPQSSFCSELSWKQGAYPSTVMGGMAKWRELYQQAWLARSYEPLYASNASGLKRPASDRIVESYYPVIDKKIPVFFKASSVVDIQRVLSLQQELKFPLMMGGVKEGWDVVDKIKSSGAKVFLSLDLPEEKKDEKSEPGKDDTENKKDSTSADPEKKALELRKMEFIKKMEAQAAVFHKAGVKFGFSTMDCSKKNVHANIRRMIVAGLSEDAALAALTIHAAELLGISDKLGTISRGKIANLVITDKPCFNEKAKVRYVFVDGRLCECNINDNAKGQDKKPDALEGSWSFVADVPQGKTDLKVFFNKEDKHYKGYISGGKLPDKTELTSITYGEKKLRFVYSVKIEDKTYDVIVEGSLEGSSFKGNLSVGQYGSFPMEGVKDPKKLKL